MIYLYDLYRDGYLQTLDRKRDADIRIWYNTAVVMFLTLVLMVGGWVFFYLGGVLCVIYLVVLCGALVGVCWSVYCLIRANFNYSYAYISSNSGIDGYVSDLEDDAEIKVREMMTDQFIEAETINGNNFKKKHRFLYLGSFGIFATVLCLFAMSIIFIISMVI